ncbi:MAG TPA: hypothetical protein PKW98_06485 [Candidatus Wallbacteria bacterium]|nr:hypothetical protein [Candidatus Wallbacteria bacterium]
MPELTSEELERIRLEEIKKIEEIERENREKKLKLQQELKKLQQQEAPGQHAAAQPPEDFDKVREQIRTREMMARGFVQVEGEWISREEFERRTSEKEEQKRIEEEKMARAKQRKVEREKASYEEYRATVIMHLKFYSIIIYLSLGLFITGAVMTITANYVRSLMVTFFFPGMVATALGLISLLTFIGLLVDSEKKLIERSIFDFDNERHYFEDESEIRDYARKFCRSIVRKIHPGLKIEEKNDEGDEEEE